MHWLILLLFCLAGAGTALAQPCTRYASPTGGGNGQSSGSPYQINSFWTDAASVAGSTLCLADGTYKGSNAMINPPDSKKGASGSPITVRAVNEGKVLITGENARNPIVLSNDNDWFAIVGVNACCSAGGVIIIQSGSDNNTLKRVVGWHAADGNTEIFGFHGSTFNLCEDCAGFGIARKIFQFSQGGNNSTCRRCWGRWDRSTWAGPKMTYTMAYNMYDFRCENCLGQWTGSLMPSSYVLGCTPEMAADYTPCGDTLTGGAVDQPYGIFSQDALVTPDDGNESLLGSIAYVLASDDFRAPAPFKFHNYGIDLTHVVSYITPGTNTSKPAYQFITLGSGGAASTATRITGISTVTPGSGGSGWTVSNTSYGTSVAAVANIYTGSSGGQVCKRYLDGVLTSEALWPWPMNQRIIDATTAAGVEVTDVTATLYGIFGTPPAQCRWDVATLLPPQAFHKVSP